MSNGNGKVVLVVGRKGSGKSTEVQNLMAKAPKSKVKLFDPFGDHPDYESYDDFKQFTSDVKALKNHIVVVEEATIFLGHWKDYDVVELLVRSRRHENIIVLVFHSFTDLPKYIFRLSNIVVAKKTLDPVEKVEALGDPKLLAIYEAVKKSENNYETFYYKYA